MTKQEKIQTIEALSTEFKNTSSVVVCDYKGLSVRKLEALRNKAREHGIKVQVAKNTLAKIAFSNAKYPESELKGTNIFVWGPEQIALSKVVCKFADENSDNFSVKLAYFDGAVVDKNHIVTMSKMPSREELIGMLLSVWTAPARYFVTGLDNLHKQKESQA